MTTMSYEEMRDMFQEWISESIKALGNDTESIKSYYGNSEECTMECYCSSYMDETGIYNGSIDPENLLISSEQFGKAKEAFNNAREMAYEEWVEEAE